MTSSLSPHTRRFRGSICAAPPRREPRSRSRVARDSLIVSTVWNGSDRRSTCVGLPSHSRRTAKTSTPRSRDDYRAERLTTSPEGKHRAGVRLRAAPPKRAPARPRSGTVRRSRSCPGGRLARRASRGARSSLARRPCRRSRPARRCPTSWTRSAMRTRRRRWRSTPRSRSASRARACTRPATSW